MPNLVRAALRAASDVDRVSVQEVLQGSKRFIVHLMLVDARVIVVLLVVVLSPLLAHLLGKHLSLELVLVDLVVVFLSHFHSLFVMPVVFHGLSVALESSLLRLSVVMVLISGFLLH